MITGARQGARSGLRRLVAAAMARDLGSFLIPGPDIARTHGLDIEAAGLRSVVSPRHASVLLVIGPVPPVLCEAAAVIYAQMVRPRAVFALGTDALSPLPAADVVAGLSQQELVEGVYRLRRTFAEGAFRPHVSDFDAAVLQIRIEYTCPMHPEVVQDEPGSCPKCGMNLMPRETQAILGQAHTGYQETDTATDNPMTSAHDHNAHHDMARGAMVEYTCPMHPEVVQGEPGSCPKCGMNLEVREQDTANHEHTGMDHSAMGQGEAAFMSMIDVTRDLPRSSDGLPMEWIEAPFGPFFPGLPGGLLMTLTLDGDTVAGSDARSLVQHGELLSHSPMDAGSFVEQLAGMEPLAPVSYRFLACRAIEKAVQVEVSSATACARVGALERERIASHLGWLVLFGQQTGFDWLIQRAAFLQLKFQCADLKQAAMLGPAILNLMKRLQRAPLLKSRTAGIGWLAQDAALRGPVARASGVRNDARGTDETFTALGFTPVDREEGDAFSRLLVRLDEITHSLALIEAAGAVELPVLAAIGDASGTGEAVVETPRGLARLELALEKGQVVAAQLETPSTHHLGLIGPLTEQQALTDALVAVGSLDLSPWEVRQ